MNNNQRELINEKLWSTFRLFGFAIGINVLSALFVFILKIVLNEESGLNFIDDWLQKVILPSAFSVIFFIIVFVVEWIRITNGDYSNIILTYNDFEEYIIEIEKNMKTYKSAKKSEKEIVLKQILKNVVDKMPLIICCLNSTEFEKISEEDKLQLINIHKFIENNIDTLNEALELVIFWKQFSNADLYSNFIGFESRSNDI